MFVDITVLDNPSVLNEFDVESNSDVALITDAYILLPCRYGGLLTLVSD